MGSDVSQQFEACGQRGEGGWYVGAFASCASLWFCALILDVSRCKAAYRRASSEGGLAKSEPRCRILAKLLVVNNSLLMM